MSEKPLVIFGTGDVAQIAKDYFTADSDYQVAAFTVDSEYCDQENFEGLPLIPFDQIVEQCPPDQFGMFVALSYSGMNKLREAKYHEAKGLGYDLVSYISSKCTFLSNFEPGDNCFIFEDNTIQPYVEIGNNVIIWSGNHIGHHSRIEDHNFVSSHVVISGHCRIGSNSFLGVNSTIGHGVNIANETLLGAGAVVAKDTEEKGVYVAPRPVKIPKTSDQIKL